MNTTRGLIALTCLLLLSAIAFPQHSTVSVDPSSIPKPKTSRFSNNRKVENETEWSSSYEFKNKLPGIEGSNIRNKTSVKLNFGKYDFKLSAEAVTPAKLDPDKMIGAFEIAAQRRFRSYSVSATNTFYFQHRRKFGIVEFQADKTWHLAEEVGVKLLTNIGYYYGLENSNNNVSNNVTWNNGIEFEGKLGKGFLAVKPMLVADNGALHKGRRVAFSLDTDYLIPFRRIRIGPKFGFTTFPYASHESHLEKRKTAIFGLLFKVM